MIVLPAALCSASPARGGAWDVAVGVEGSSGWKQDERALGGEGAARVTWYPRQPIDDGTPLGLQPYMQRVGAIRGWIGGGGFSTTKPAWSRAYAGQTFYGGLSADQHLTEWLAIFGGASLSRWRTRGPAAEPAGPPFLLPSLTAGAGLRVVDTRLDLAVNYAPVLSEGADDGRTTLFFVAGFATLVGRWTLLEAGGSTLSKGGTLRGRFVQYLTPESSVGVELAFAAGQLYFNAPRVYGRSTARAQVGYWFTHHLEGRLVCAFDHTVEARTRLASDDLGVSLGMSMRLP